MKSSFKRKYMVIIVKLKKKKVKIVFFLMFRNKSSFFFLYLSTTKTQSSALPPGLFCSCDCFHHQEISWISNRFLCNKTDCKRSFLLQLQQCHKHWIVHVPEFRKVNDRIDHISCINQNKDSHPRYFCIKYSLFRSYLFREQRHHVRYCTKNNFCSQEIKM